MSIQRLALSINPPIFVIEYDSMNGKTFTKRLFLEKLLKVAVSSDDVVSAIMKKIDSLVGEQGSCATQVHELVEYLMTHRSLLSDVSDNAKTVPEPADVASPATAATPATFVFKKVTVNSNPTDILNMDLNTCSDELNQKAKELMNADFEQKRLKPGDEGFEWNKEVEFGPPAEATDWDDEDDE